MNEGMMNRSYEVQVKEESLGHYVAKTFDWMFAGLLIMFMVTVRGYVTRAIAYVYATPYWHYIPPATKLGVVIFLSTRIEKMSAGMARVLPFLHVAFNGIVFCAHLIVFDLTILWTVFGITSVFFGIVALIGWFGDINLAKIRSFMMGNLIFLVFFWLLAMFINLSAFETTVSMIGIFPSLIFVAHDTRKTQAYHMYYGQVPEIAAKASTFAALQLYLDFTNLFIYLLHMLERRRS